MLLVLLCWKKVNKMVDILIAATAFVGIASMCAVAIIGVIMMFKD